MTNEAKDPTSVVLFFIDGLGIGTRGPHNPLDNLPDATPLAVFQNEDPELFLGGVVVPTDPCLGVPGRPQSASGQTTILTGPDLAKVVTSDGVTAPVVTDGPFQEFKEWIAGFQVFDVDSEERAIEIAARISAVPGPGGRPIEQPIQVRRIMQEGPPPTAAVDEWLETAGGGARRA